MPFTVLEQQWLDWAWNVLAKTPSHHVAACVALGGSTSDIAALNPGFVGRSYRPGGVLAASLAWGAGSQGTAAPADDPRRTWVRERNADLSGADERFLDGWRSSFVADQDSNSWWRTKVGWFVEGELGLSRQDLAVANLAACHMSDVGQGERLARLCQGTHDFGRLVAALDPVVIVCPSVAVARLLDLGDMPVAPLVIGWDGRTFKRGDRLRSEWVPEAVKEASALLSRAQPAPALPVQGVCGPVWVPSPRPVTPATPDNPVTVDPDKVGRGCAAHFDTLTALAQAVHAAGLLPREGTTGCPYDLAWEVGDVLVVAEVKSLTSANEVHQIRLGLGQVLHYRHLLSGNNYSEVVAALVVERSPDSPVWSGVCEGAQVILSWPGSRVNLPGLRW